MNRASIAVVLLFLLIYVVPLGVRPMAIPDESRYGEIPREMIATGDWVVPRLNGILYFEKPVLGYWLNAVSIMTFGENAFAVRLPAALAAGLSAIMLFFLLRRFGGGYLPGILAAAVLLTSLLHFGVGVFAVLDSMLASFVTGALVAFFFAYKEKDVRKRLGFLVLFGAFCGLAFLTKGFLAFVVPLVTIVPFLLWEKQWREFFRMPWIPLAVAVLVSLPWAVMVHVKDTDFWRYFVIVEHWERFFAAPKPQHPEPWYFFVPIFIGTAMPWTLMLPAIARGHFNTKLKGSLARFALCWFVFPFLFFSASSGKLGTYILPCFAPFAVLATTGLIGYFTAGKKSLFNIGSLLLAAGSAIFGVLLVVSQTTDFLGDVLFDAADTRRLYAPAEAWKWLLTLTGFLAMAALSLLAGRANEFRRKLAFFCAAPLLFMFCLQVVIPDHFKDGKAPEEFLECHATKIKPETILVSDNYMVHAVCWAYKRTDVYLHWDGGELSYGLGRTGKRRLLDSEQFRKLIKDNAGKRRIALITDAGDYHKMYKPRLLKPSLVIEESGFVLVQY